MGVGEGDVWVDMDYLDRVVTGGKRWRCIVGRRGGGRCVGLMCGALGTVRMRLSRGQMMVRRSRSWFRGRWWRGWCGRGVGWGLGL